MFNKRTTEEKGEQFNMSRYVLYVLVSMSSGGRSGRRTYVGVTTNLGRRVRQHNGLLRGGAKATRGRQWRVAAVVSGLVGRSEAQRLEWALHHPRRAAKKRGVFKRLRHPFSRRIAHLRYFLSVPRWCPPRPLDLKWIYRSMRPVYAAKTIVLLRDLPYVPAPFRKYLLL